MLRRCLVFFPTFLNKRPSPEHEKHVALFEHGKWQRSDFDAAKKSAMQRQMNRARGARAIMRSKGTEHCDNFVTRARIFRFWRAASVKAIVGALLSSARC